MHFRVAVVCLFFPNYKCTCTVEYLVLFTKYLLHVVVLTEDGAVIKLLLE